MASGSALVRSIVLAVAFLAATTAAARADCASRSNYGAGIVFATDREPLGDDRIFGGERARETGADDDVTTGTLTTPRPAGTRGCTSRLAFFQALDHRFVRGHGRRALVYVHGADTSFVTAARDALALRHDLQFPGPVILYSWPATVTAKPAYGTESRNAAWSVPHFATFVGMLEAHFHGMPISFVARGIGARFVTTGLRVVRGPRCHHCFGRAVFVEPEIARQALHRRLADARLCDVRHDPRRTAAPVTIYSATRRSSECSGIDTVRIAASKIVASDGHAPVVSAALARDMRLALAGTPLLERVRRRKPGRNRRSSVSREL